MQSAEFMADFVWWDAQTGRYVLGLPLLSGSEHTPPPRSFNSTVELSYWFYGLRTAQLWRERLGLPREPEWDRVLAKLSKAPVVSGLCADVESFPEYKGGRPAWLEANGFNNAGSRPYLPAHGGLLWAAAMMAAGWDGCPDRPAPGFPADRNWVVRWEGLNKAP